MIKFDSICIVGVDGTGKSTLVKMIYEMLGKDNSVIQYMGYKNWETRIAKICFSNSNKMLSPFRHLSTIIEYYHRVYKYKGERRVVIFDRYVDERILAVRQDGTLKKRIIKKMYELFLKRFFYQPTLLFYLTCDLETSICRKNDINTEEEIEILKESKERLDRYYMDKENAVVIDTSHLTINSTLHIIQEKMEKELCFNNILKIYDE